MLVVVLNLAVLFCPITDNDFTDFYAWVNSITYWQSPDMTSVPLTAGNVNYIVFQLVVDYIEVLIACAYAGLFVREARQELKIVGFSPISKRGFVLRLFIIAVFIILAVIPFGLVFIATTFMAILLIPVIIMFPAAYLSGDSGLWKSLGRSFSLTFRHYFTNIFIPACVYMIYELLGMLVGGILYQFSTTAYYVFMTFASTWCLFAMARWGAMAYSTLTALRSHKN